MKNGFFFHLAKPKKKPQKSYRLSYRCNIKEEILEAEDVITCDASDRNLWRRHSYMLCMVTS